MPKGFQSKRDSARTTETPKLPHLRPDGEQLTVDELETPVTVVDLDRMEHNIKRMAELSTTNGLQLRPMIKTHKSPIIARKQMDAGAIGVLVASIDEAELMVRAGVKDITIAYPFIGAAQMRRVARIVERARVTLSVDSIEAVTLLADGLVDTDNTVPAPSAALPVLILIDSGGRRLGVQPEQAIGIARAIAAADRLQLAGVATHPGHAYAAISPEKLDEAAADETGAVIRAASLLRSKGFDVPVVAIGSTPTATRSAPVEGITEMRPGNYVFYDAIQLGLGVASEKDCALYIIGTVLSRPTPGTAVIDVGSKMLSSDQGAHGLSLVRGYGRVAGEPDVVVERVSEELAVITLPENHPLRIGERLRIIPNHACTAVNLVDVLVGIRQGRVEELIPVEARRQNFRM